MVDMNTRSTCINILTLFNYLLYISRVFSFEIYWNVPSHKCSSAYGINLNLSAFHILHNKDEMFNGEVISLFYEPKPGLYPKYLPNGTEENGGIPQNVSYYKHFKKAISDIQQTISDSKSSGLSIIDWESWRPIFERNKYDKDKEIYITKSTERVKNQHPTWSDEKVHEEAKKEFETSARNLMEATLLLARWIRPLGRWGFYGFPRCFNFREGQAECANDTKAYNDQLYWLFKTSTALFPSIYLSTVFSTIEERKKRIQGILNETLRIQEKFSVGDPLPAYAYTTYRYTDTLAFYKQSDVINTIGQSVDAGLDGAIIWGSSSDLRDADDCKQLQKFLLQDLGPISKFIINFSRICSENLCSGHGKCVRANWLQETVVSGFQFDKPNRVHFSNYKCRCDKNWMGDKCNEPG